MLLSISLSARRACVWRMSYHCLAVCGLALAASAIAADTDRTSPSNGIGLFREVGDVVAADQGMARLRVDIVTDAEPEKALPARVTITASDGTHPDGSGRGVYQDGRFFAEGSFTVSLIPGQTKILIRCGPEFECVEKTVVLAAGHMVHYRATPRRWIDLAKTGWYGGDHHVHTQHDPSAAIRIDPGYTALQARANGLSVITEADANFPAEAVRPFATGTFLYRNAPELRPGPYVGHLITPGIAAPFSDKVVEALVHRPLPALAVREAVHRNGGVLIRTHTLVPPHQLHWMGATEVWSDAVLGECGDLMDVDGPASEMLWFAALNLHNHAGVSSYTDCALGRLSTLSPGDRRVYAKADRLDYAAIIEAMHRGHTFATSGGPVFAFLDVEGSGPGDTFKCEGDKEFGVAVQVRCLKPLGRVELISEAGVIQSFEVKGRSGDVTFTPRLSTKHAREWLVLRAEDEAGDWAITSPVYIEPAAGKGPSPSAPGHAAAVLMEIGNHTRFSEPRLGRKFFAHLLLTVAPTEELTEVRIMKDGQSLQAWKPADGDSLSDGRIPVTDIQGEYAPGWQWYRIHDHLCHFQADAPLNSDGWYHAEATTSAGRTVRSDEIHFDPADVRSRAMSVARMEGEGTRLTLQGYGEDLPLDSFPPKAAPDWWYKDRRAYRLQGEYHGSLRETSGGKTDVLDRLFRSSEDQQQR